MRTLRKVGVSLAILGAGLVAAPAAQADTYEHLGGCGGVGWIQQTNSAGQVVALMWFNTSGGWGYRDAILGTGCEGRDLGIIHG